ncbi:hypothetical protein [Streptosporangium sandarakinum]|uniref:hypothetical protein n=1 Tax=Streptosporangium sandarakinum TaxID=1260955 RepID=UPI0037235FEF
MVLNVLDDPFGLSPRAQWFLQEKGRREREPTAEELHKHWQRHGKAGPLLDLMVTYQARWGGLALPELTVPLYDGGVAVMTAGDLGDIEGVDPCFTAGTDHYSVAHWFCVDLQGRFGILYEDWVPLHSSVSGWIEAYALADAAQRMHRVEVWKGRQATDRARALIAALPELARVPEVEGLADNWWQGDEALLALYEGEAKVFRSEEAAFAALYAETEQRAEELRAALRHIDA